MLRNVSLEDISDGRMYTENDLVRVDTNSCKGCQTVCCQNMGSTIVIGPYDCYKLTTGLGKTFEQLTMNELELNVVDGIIMPNLKMHKSDGRCAFLREDNLCNIHTIRPGICRMFPLGRYWEDETHFKYIVQKGECNKDNLSKIKLKKWLGIEGLVEYDSYIVRWHEYVKLLQAALPGLSENNVKILNTFNLRVFYMTTYAGCADDKAFYAEFDRRLAMAKEKLGLM